MGERSKGKARVWLPFHFCALSISGGKKRLVNSTFPPAGATNWGIPSLCLVCHACMHMGRNHTLCLKGRLLLYGSLLFRTFYSTLGWALLGVGAAKAIRLQRVLLNLTRKATKKTTFTHTRGDSYPRENGVFESDTHLTFPHFHLKASTPRRVDLHTETGAALSLFAFQ